MLALFPLLYLAAIIAVGLAHRRGNDTQSGFFLARRSANQWLVVGSLLATSLGAFGVMGLSGMASSKGLVAAWHIWSGVPGMILLGAWAYRRLDARDVYSLPELLGRSYGINVRRLSAALIVIAWLSIVAAQIIAAGKILQFLGIQSGLWGTNGGSTLWIMLVAVIFIAYTCIGGQHSVLRTDFIQAIIIILGLAILIAGVLREHPAIISEIPSERLQLPFNPEMPFSKWVIIMLTFGVPFLVGPDIYSRLFTGRDENTARRAALIAGVLMLPVFFLVVFAGVLGGQLLPSDLHNDTILLHLSAESLSPILVGLVIASLLAAIMSSADTTLMTVSTLVTRDLMHTFTRRPAQESTIIMQARIVILVAGLLSLVIAIWLQDIVKALYTSYYLYSPAVLAPFLFLLAFPRRRFRTWTGLAAIGLAAAFATASLATGNSYLMYAAYLAPILPLAIDSTSRAE